MIWRLIRHVLGGILVLLILTGIALLVVLRTEGGQEFAANMVLPRVTAATGIGIKYVKLGGAWPRKIEISGLELSDQKGVFFTARKVSLFWHPTGLLSDVIAVERAEIDDGALYREPVLKGSTEAARSNGRGGLPSARIGSLRLLHFKVAKSVAGTDLAFSLDSSLTLLTKGNVNAAIALDMDTPAGLGSRLETILGAGEIIQARISGNLHSKLMLSITRAKTRNGNLTLTGASSYERATKDISLVLNGQLSGQAASALDKKMSTQAPVGVAARVSGRLSDLKLEAELRTGSVTIDGKRVAPLTARASMRYHDKTITGPVSLRIIDPKAASPGLFSAVVSYTPSKHISLRDVAFSYLGASVKGSADLYLKPFAGHANLVLNAPDLAALPIPADVAGALMASATIDIGANTTILASATSDHLVVAGIDAAGASLSAQGTLKSLKLQAKFASLIEPRAGEFRAVDIAGTLAAKGGEKTIDLTRLSTLYRGVNLRQKGPAVVTQGPQGFSVRNLDLDWGGEGRVAGNASLAGKTLKANLTFDNIQPPQIAASASGTLKIHTGQTPAGTIDVSLVSNQLGETPVRSNISGTWDGKRLAVKASFGGSARGRRTPIEPFTASLPLRWAPPEGGLVSIKGPINGQLAYDGPIERLLAIFPLDGERLTGPAKIDMAVSGTLDSPVLSGTAALREAAYEDAAAGILFDHLNLNGHVEHGPTGYDLSFDLSAADGRDDTVSVRGQGTATLGAHAPVVDATLTLGHARVVHSQAVTAIASGKLSLSGTMPDLSATGNVDINSLDANIPSSLPPDIVEVKVVAVDAQGKPIQTPGPTAKPGTRIKVALDIGVQAQNQLFIRGRGLDSEWSTDLHVNGTIADPRISGTADLRRGSFDFAGHQFKLVSGRITFVPTRSMDPDLNLVAQYTTTDNTVASMTVTGRASDPKIALTSSPSLPQEDIMALILFGKPIRQVSGLQAAQIAQAIGQLTGEGPFKGPGILGRARSMLGLDLLNLSLGGEGGPGVTVGKYVAKGVFVEASPSFASNAGSVGVTIDVTKHVNVKTQVGQDSQSNVSVNWQHDY